MAAEAVALGRLVITRYKARRLTPQVQVVQALQPKLPAHKRTLLEAVEVGHGQLTLQHRAVWAEAVLAAPVGRLVLMQAQGLQTPAVEAGVLVKALTPQLLQVALAVAA